ncbi:MAG: hypothetical protein RLZZ161_708 [Bacteroidota bacterium]|jgi:carboxyl-terminal processing protease
MGNTCVSFLAVPYVTLPFMEIRIRISKITLLAFMALVLSTGYKTYDNLFEYSKNLEIFATAYKNVGTNFVDDVNPGILMRKGLDAMLASLDPYTNFYSEAQTEEAMIERQGEYGGVGCRIFLRNRYPVVSEVFRGYAFANADIRCGDIIKFVSGQDMAGKSTNDVGAMLRGAPNTAVTLIIERNGKQLEKKITRVSVRTKNVPWSGMINEQTGYIKLDEFGQNCAQEIETALATLQKNPGMNKLVLDLRGNGGGLLAEAVDIVGLFVGENKMVVNMKGRTAESNRKWMTRKPAIAPELPLVVLVDAQSASASEVVSGSLQDMDRAVIVGQNSFGKGLVQNFYPLPYRTQMKITTAKYYTPSGRCIQLLDYSKRNPDGSAGIIPDSLRKAFKTAAGRTVYDGGGIRPDVVVDPFSGEPLIKYLLEERYVFDFANEFRNNNESLPVTDRFITAEQFDAFGKQCAAKLKVQLRKKMEEALQNSVKDEELVKMIMNGLSDAKLEKAVLDHINHCGETLMYRMESEIIARYSSDEREYKHMFVGDPDLAAALKTLNNTEAYNRILRK